jgi:hypothetical protein
MLTVKQVFELARDGAFEQYNSAIKYGSFTLAKQVFQTIKEIQSVLENLDKKENYIASSNPATETAVLFALNLKDGEVQELRATQQQTKKFPPEYMVQLELVKCSKIGPGISKKFYSTLEEANKEFLGWKTANENMNCYSVRLCEKTGDGKYKVLARSLPKDYTTEPKSQELYQVRIIHLTNKVQVLKFDILKAAEATFELLKYELEVKRIRGASVVKTIPKVGFRQEMYQIGSR